MRQITVFFSCPGDLADEKARLESVIGEMRPVFARLGISLMPWMFEKDAVPAVAPADGSVQTVIDKQLPRNPDGSLSYDLYVGLMGERIGTPVEGAASGTVHEFIEAKETFQRTGKPHILFYFRDMSSRAPAGDVQLEAVRRFRAEYPGLLASFRTTKDLEAQFRRHLLSELLDLVIPTGAPRSAAAGEWGQSVFDRYSRLKNKAESFLDISPEKPRRIMRLLHELLGIHYHLSEREEQILIGALYCCLLGTVDHERRKELLEDPELLDEVNQVVDASRATSKPLLRPKGQPRVDLLAALVEIGLRLDINRKAISPTATSLPDIHLALIDEWLAYLTADITCQHAVLRFHLLAPSERWVTPLVGATAVAMESLWQRVRPVLTKHEMSFAVARSRIELDSELDSLPDSILDKIRSAGEEATNSLPKFPHFGEAGVPTTEELLPLPASKISRPVTFYPPAQRRVRLVVDGITVANRPDGASENIEYWPCVDAPVDCVLECDEVGEFVPVARCRVQRLSPIEQAVLEVTQDNSEAFRTLGLWNELMRIIWPRVIASQADYSELSDAFHILRDALDLASQDKMPLDRRDLYWDAIGIVSNRMKQKEVAT